MTTADLLSPRAHPVAAGVPFVRALRAFGPRTALVQGALRVGYGELADRVEAAAARLGTTRRLVLVQAAPTVEAVVAYLAALHGGHPVLLSGDGAATDVLAASYDPDVVAGPAAGGVVRWDERRPGTRHDLHPELALLLSTSGSTGSPKLVRLSAVNLQANATAVADSLGIRADDRAVTTLPLHYCYGLSVLHSHLLRGAAVVLSDLSVVDACFWDLVREQGVTSFAGVPHTFDLLGRVGFAGMRLPDLRYVTQAGGRLAPERVRHWARIGRERGWELVVMYGQTEATARMAYLPPHLAESRPEAVGMPVPGGSLTVRPVPEAVDLGPGAGELVYAGPNVMLGYATGPADLSLGRTVDVLRTGDIARRAPDGLYEVVGRLSRFAKPYGLRVDLDRVQSLVAEEIGAPTCCVGDDRGLTLAVEGQVDPARVRAVAARVCGVPPGAVAVHPVPALPRLPSGKPDLRAVQQLAATATGPVPAAQAGAVDAETLRALYAELLDRPDATDVDSFVDLGGDSLSYVEVSVRLEELLGHLPAGWHTTPVRELVPTARSRRRPGRSIETSVVLRAVAIVLVVGTHAKLFTLLGSAHVLIAVAGYNFARFQLTSAPRLQRLRRQLGSVGRIAAPCMAWLAGAYLLTDLYSPANVLLLNGLLGPETWTTQWQLWFVEVLVYLLLLLAVLMALPWADRAERRFPFGFALLPLGVGLLARFELVTLAVGPVHLHTRPVLWLFALGWAAARARTSAQRLLVTSVTVAAVPGFFDDPRREALMVAGLVALVWIPAVRLPAVVGRLAGVLAGASLFVYLTHWVVYPHLDDHSPLLAVLASLGVGIGYWALVSCLLAVPGRGFGPVPPLFQRAGRSAGEGPGGEPGRALRVIDSIRAGGTTVARLLPSRPGTAVLRWSDAPRAVLTARPRVPAGTVSDPGSTRGPGR